MNSFSIQLLLTNAIGHFVKRNREQYNCCKRVEYIMDLYGFFHDKILQKGQTSF